MAGPTNFSNPSTILTYKAGNEQALKAKIAQYRASAETLRKAADKINEQAVRELSTLAGRELKRRIRTRGRQQSRNQTLVELASNHRSNSSWDAKGFHFFDPKVVRYSRAFPYYRAIEAGSRHMVNRYIPLTFFRGGTQVLPPSVRYRQVERAAGGTGSRPRGSQYTQRNVAKAKALTSPESIGQLKDYGTYSGQRGTPYVVRIRNPIPAYRYIATATGSFVANKRYTAIVEARVRSLAPILAKNMKRS